MVLVTLSDGRQVIDPRNLNDRLEKKFVEMCREECPDSVIERPFGYVTINITERPKVPEVAEVAAEPEVSASEPSDTSVTTPPKRKRQRRHKAASHRK